MSSGIEGSYNFRRVSAALTTSGVVGSPRLQALAGQGYQALINLLPDSSEQAVVEEAQLVRAQGLEYIHIPVDFVQPGVAEYTQFCAHMDRLSRATVHVHCAANYRVTAFYACYAEQCGLWSPAQALAFIEDVWQPQDYPGWVQWFKAVRA